MNALIRLFRMARGSIHAQLGRFFVALALACLAHSAYAGTSGVANGDFDLDLSGWDLSGSPVPFWSTLDHEGDPASGSVALSNSDAQANVRVYPLRQCIALSGPGTYAVAADGLLPAGHLSGRLVLSYSSRSISDCSGGFNFSGGYFLQSNGNWMHGTANIILNPGLNYIEVSLGIEKDAAGGSLTGNFDAVHLIDRDRIFSSGFEAPDLP